MIIGTAGHVDHGKTALVRALTGIDTDRLKEEKRRGISIDLGFAYMATPDGGVIGFVDVPGHERFLHNMLAGASGIDYALLVVAADDGIMPQSVEHLAIIDLLGISCGLVALTKVDLVPPLERAQIAANITRLLEPTSLAGVPIVEVSSTRGDGVDELRRQLFEAAQAHAPRASQGRFRLAVDRSFTLAGAGTIVTGTVLSGTVAVEDRVLVSPSGLAARVRSIHAQNHPAERGHAGERCALNLVGDGVTKEAVTRGDVVLDPGLHAPSERIDVRLRVLSTEQRPIVQWLPVHFHHGAIECAARVVLLGDTPLAPGAEGWAQLVLDRPVAAAAGDRFVLRDTSAQRTIGGGRLTDLHAPARKRRTPERLARLEALAQANPERALGDLVAIPPGFVDLSGFARDRTLTSVEVESIASRLGMVRIMVQGMTFALSANAWTAFRHDLKTKLAGFHAENPDLQGIGRERLRLALQPRLPAALFLAALQALAGRGEIALDGAWVRLATHQARLTAEHEALWAKIQPLLGGKERFRPPRVRDVAERLRLQETNVRRVLKLASRLGFVDEIAHDHFFLRRSVAEILDIMQRMAADRPAEQFTAAELRDRLDNGRKVAIQILEFFDRHGVTLRRGDLRRINRHRLDLFGPLTGVPPDGPAPRHDGREASPVGRPDFKSGKGREPVLGGFDPHSLPPSRRNAR